MDGAQDPREELLASQSLEQSFQMSAFDQHAIVSVTDLEGVISYANANFLEITGYRGDEVVGARHSILNSGTHSTEFYRGMWDAIHAGKSWTGEIRNKKKNGDHYWIKSTIVPFVNEVGEVVKFTAISTDITQVKNAEVNRQLKASFDFIRDEVYVFWPDNFNLIYLNKQALSQTSWTASEVVQYKVSDLNQVFSVYNEVFEPEKLKELLVNLVAGDKDIVCCEFSGKEGKDFEASIQIVRPEHQKERVVVIFRDITDRKLAEKKVSQLSKTLDFIQNQVYVFNPDTLVFEYVNRAAIDQIGYSREELMQMSLVDIKPDFDFANFREEVKFLISGEKHVLEIESIHRRKNGEFFPVEIDLQYLAPVGELPRFVAVVKDISERKAQEEEIGHLKTSLDLGENEVYMFWVDTLEYIYLNRAAMQRSGLTNETFRGKRPSDHLSGNEVERFLKRAKPLLDGTKSTLVFEVYDKIRCRPMEVTLQLIQPKNERPRFFAIYQDITARKAADSKINVLKTSLDFMRAEIYMYHPETLQYIYMNNAAQRRLGWTEEEYRTKTPADVTEFFDEERFRKRISVLLSGKAKSLSFESTGTKGEPIEITEQLLDREGEIPRIVTVIRDISDRKAAEKEVESFKTTLDFTNDPVFVFRPSTLHFSYMNNAAKAHFGWSEEEYQTKTIADVTEGFEIEAFRIKTKPLVFGTVSSQLYETRDINGIPFETNLQLIDFDGAEPRFVAVSRNISERKEIEKRKTEFVATVSHELRTPLTSIKGALGLLAAGVGGDVSSKHKAMIEIANKNSDRLMMLINDILDLEKIESGMMEFDFGPISVAELMTEAVEANKAYGDKYDVKFEIAGGEQDLFVRADGNRIMQVMSNLLSNAAKFSNPGGRIKICFGSQDDRVLVSVRDYGQGIPEHAQATIFHKFTQVDTSDTRQKGGTGLGLNIAKKIIDRHGGKLAFDTAENQGTMFFFDLEKNVV